jgi:hypothetical protein
LFSLSLCTHEFSVRGVQRAKDAWQQAATAAVRSDARSAAREVRRKTLSECLIAPTALLMRTEHAPSSVSPLLPIVFAIFARRSAIFDAAAATPPFVHAAFMKRELIDVALDAFDAHAAPSHIEA